MCENLIFKHVTGLSLSIDFTIIHYSTPLCRAGLMGPCQIAAELELQPEVLLDFTYSLHSGVFQHLDCGIRSLKQIDISMNGLQGDIPGDGIGNSTQLVHLDMSLNRFNGSIPNQIFSLTSLGYLDMSENLLEGKLGPELKI
ncbi:leucine-rich repeat-containing protein [Tanacetum coccineum]